MRRRYRCNPRALAHFDDTLLTAAASLAEDRAVVTTTHLFVAAIERSEELFTWWESVSSRGMSLREAAGFLTQTGKSNDSPPTAFNLGVSFDSSASQAVGSASKWAKERAEQAGTAHLVVVLIDQGSAPIADALTAAGVEAAMLRTQALALIGVRSDHPPVVLDPLPPKGTSNRPALAVSALPEDAWAECFHRQAVLPLERLHRRSDGDAIILNEQRAVLGLVDRFTLDDDQLYSLLHHHLDEVRRREAAAMPSLFDQPHPSSAAIRPLAGVLPMATRRRHHLVPSGWRCWFANRHVSLQARWLHLAERHG